MDVICFAYFYKCGYFIFNIVSALQNYFHRIHGGQPVLLMA